MFAKKITFLLQNIFTVKSFHPECRFRNADFFAFEVIYICNNKYGSSISIAKMEDQNEAPAINSI